MGKQQAMLLWNDSFSVGVREIDDQHKELVEILNELVALVGEYPGSANQEITSIIEKIDAYKTVHFETEEKYFKQFNYAGADEHIQAHKDFNEKVGELVASFQKNSEKEQLLELVDFIENWFSDHVLNMDHKYVHCFKEGGLE
jgi:hemerythrin-like metal-binding protein